MHDTYPPYLDHERQRVLAALREFKAHHGHLRVPQKHKCASDGDAVGAATRSRAQPTTRFRFVASWTHFWHLTRRVALSQTTSMIELIWRCSEPLKSGSASSRARERRCTPCLRPMPLWWCGGVVCVHVQGPKAFAAVFVSTLSNSR